eukprot:382040_1
MSHVRNAINTILDNGGSDSKKNNAVISRNKAKTKWFIQFWTFPDEWLGLNRNKLLICDMDITHIMPKSIIDHIQNKEADFILCAFVTFCWFKIKTCHLHYKSSMRPVIGYISHCLNVGAIGADIEAMKQYYPKTWLVICKIRKTVEYMTAIHEKAPAPTEEDEEKILNMPLFTPNGTPIRWNIWRRVHFQLTSSLYMRGANTHAFNEEDVTEKVNPFSNRWGVFCKTEGVNRAKHRKDETHGGECCCNGNPNIDHGHIDTNTKCIRYIVKLYKSIKISDRKHCHSGMVQWKTPFAKLAFYRGLKYQDGKKTDCYYTLNRISKKKLDKNLSVLNVEQHLSISLGSNKDANKNERKTDFSSHSNKMYGVRKTNKKIGKKLTDKEKHLLAGKSWDQYADAKEDTKLKLIAKVGKETRQLEMNQTILSLPPIQFNTNNLQSSMNRIQSSN